ASFMIAKRGVKVDYIHFHSYPYTSKASIEKTKDIIKTLQNFQLGNNLYLVPFADAQKEIVAKAPARFRIILYRRFMLRISEKIAKENGYLALITGESVGQVASQTLENIGAIGEVVDLPILRPISGMNKGEVIEIAKDIGTYKTSIWPCQDTCSWFMPDKPATTPDIKKVRSAEANLTIDKLVDDMIKLTELVQVEKI
ncbi:MAG: tRNA 4-thiouridine(8) synthase ThiI, partial [Candidatus Paceibacterota bacterium]